MVIIPEIRFFNRNAFISPLNTQMWKDQTPIRVTSAQSIVHFDSAYLAYDALRGFPPLSTEQLTDQLVVRTGKLRLFFLILLTFEDLD